MTRFVILAAVAALFATPAVAGDIGGGIGVSHMTSGVAGFNAAGSVQGVAVLGTGSLNGQVTNSAHSDQLAGTISKFEKLPGGFTASIVSEMQGNSWSQQTANINSVGFAGMVNVGAGVAFGGGVSGGSLDAITGYVNW